MGPPSTRFVRYGVCWVTADKQALPPNSTMEMGSQSHRRRAVAASGLLLLGALAMLAVMTTQDADQSAPVARMDVAADEIAQEDTLTEAPMAKVDHFDSMRAWATAKAQAKKVSHAAKRLKKAASKANNDLKKKQQLARKSKKKQAAKMGKLTHKKHVKLRRAAAHATAKAVRKAMKNVMGGVNTLAAKAATDAAKSVVIADQKKKAAAEKAERIAEVKEGRLQHMVDRLGFLRRRIRKIQLKEIKVRRKAKKKAQKYAKSVASHVVRAKKHFEAMRRLLIQLRKAVNATKRDQASINRMNATLAVLKRHIKRRFASKRRRVKRRYLKLIRALKQQIKEEKYRKSRPDRNGQARLNALNVRSQTLVVKLNENMREIKELQRHLHKAKKENKTMAKKAHKRKVVLKVAQSAYRHLSHAVKRLKKIVMLNKQRDRVISERPVGLGFTKKLLHTVGKSVKKAVNKAKSAGLKRLKAGGKKGAAKAY